MITTEILIRNHETTKQFLFKLKESKTPKELFTMLVSNILWKNLQTMTLLGNGDQVVQMLVIRECIRYLRYRNQRRVFDGDEGYRDWWGEPKRGTSGTNRKVRIRSCNDHPSRKALRMLGFPQVFPSFSPCSFFSEMKLRVAVISSTEAEVIKGSIMAFIALSLL